MSIQKTRKIQKIGKRLILKGAPSGMQGTSYATVRQVNQVIEQINNRFELVADAIDALIDAVEALEAATPGTLGAAIVTDGTLTGNGTTASPLSVDTASINTLIANYLAANPVTTTNNLGGVQANLTANRAVNPTTFIPFTITTTDNNPDIIPDIASGEITVDTPGTYLVQWVVNSDNDNAVALTLNGNVATAIAPTGSYLITAAAGDVIALMNVAGAVLNVTSAMLNVTGVI